MIPDYGMCAAMFPGFDALGAVQKWVEEGIAPDHIKATYGSGPPISRAGGHAGYATIKESGPQNAACLPLSAGGNLQRERRHERRGEFPLRGSDLVVSWIFTDAGCSSRHNLMRERHFQGRSLRLFLMCAELACANRILIYNPSRHLGLDWENVAAHAG